jgi:hypothetical protein
MKVHPISSKFRFLILSVFVAQGMSLCLFAFSGMLTDKAKALSLPPVILLTAPPNGKVLFQLKQKGVGQLTVKNGTAHDAVVKLINPRLNKVVASFYVRANQNAELKDIPNGSYNVVFGTGKYWSPSAARFTKQVSYSMFEKTFDFTTRTRQEGESRVTEYSVFEITLHPVVNGNVKTKNISEKDFQKYQ